MYTTGAIILLMVHGALSERTQCPDMNNIFYPPPLLWEFPCVIPSLSDPIVFLAKDVIDGIECWAVSTTISEFEFEF